MISSLTIKNVATFDNENGVTISDLKKVNFFFGFNGSGKSTIAKYLRNIGLDAVEQNNIFINCSNTGFDNQIHQILTFNEDFIEENFRRSQDFKGVFSLDQSNALIDQQIADEESNIRKYETLRSKYESRIVVIENDKRSKLDTLIKECWNQRTTFSTFHKINLAHSGSKPNHLQEIRRILQNPKRQVLNLQEITDQYTSLYEKELRNVADTISIKSYLNIRRIEVQLENLLQEVIVGNEDVDIAGLIEIVNSRNWVEQGLSFLRPDVNTCPFCQKETIDKQLREQFEKYFDETYKDKIKEISKLRENYYEESNTFINSIASIQSVFNPNNIISNLVIKLNSLFQSNLKIVDYKIDHSNEKKSISSLNESKDELSNILGKIKLNNKLFNDLDTNKTILLRIIWNYIAEHCKQKILDYDKREKKYSKITTIATELKSSYSKKILSGRQKIETLRSKTVNTKDAVDNINLILKSAGFEGFEIDEKDKVNNISRYYLKRLNSSNTSTVFDSLSEGEKNFISFLYFYQLCLGSDDLRYNGSKKKIIVIDDPVSSLDSQSLFIVSTLIHSLIQRKEEDKPSRKLLKNKNIAQVFILTHNIYFYKEVSFDKRPICTDFWHYQISKLNNQTSISGEYNKTVFDDYSLMWKTIKDIKADNSNNSSLNIMISNLMRRIIESYVNFVGYGRDSWAALNNVDSKDPSYYILCAFISTINDESHKISALDSAYYQKIINEQPQILFNVFATIFKSIGKDHYEMMMKEKL